MRDFRLDGRAALVTGARRGLGRAIAASLAEAGARVTITHQGDADRMEAEETAHAIGAAHLLAGDLADPDVPAHLVNHAAARMGGLQILVCNATYERRESLDQIGFHEAAAQWQVNVMAAMAMARAARPVMRGWGRILFLGSIQQLRPNPHQLVYAATKSAIANVARNLAKQFAPDGITVNTLCPGAIATGGNAAALAVPGYRELVEARIPLGRIGDPADVAGPALLLCSEAGRYITGAELAVDGGLALG
jgi:NAD(P)-dependent dehydrogenase (short-subunit alcohol dehydrogenase family)